MYRLSHLVADWGGVDLDLAYLAGGLPRQNGKIGFFCQFFDCGLWSEKLIHMVILLILGKRKAKAWVWQRLNGQSHSLSTQAQAFY